MRRKPPCPCRAVAVIGRKRDVAFATVKHGHPRTVPLATLLVVTPHLLRGSP